MRRFIVIMTVLTLLFSCSMLFAKKSKKEEAAPVAPVVEAPKPLKTQAQEKAQEGEKLFSENKFDAAAEAFEAALSLFMEAAKDATPEDSIPEAIERMNKNLSITFDKGQDFSKAIEYYKIRLKADSLNTDLVNSIYVAYKDGIGDEDSAISFLEPFATRHPNYDYAAILGTYYNNKNNQTAAIKWYEKALSFKSDPNIILNLAGAYRDTKQSSKAIAQYEAYLKTNPPADKIPVVLKIVGGEYKKMGNAAKELEYFEKYLGIEKDSQIALYVANRYLKSGNYAKSIKWSTVVLGSEPNDADALFIRGYSKYSQQDKNKKVIDKAGATADLSKLLNNPKYQKNAQQMIDYMKSN